MCPKSNGECLRVERRSIRQVEVLVDVIRRKGGESSSHAVSRDVQGLIFVLMGTTAPKQIEVVRGDAVNVKSKRCQYYSTSGIERRGPVQA